MKSLSLEELKKVTFSYFNNEISADEIFKWAAGINQQYASRELEFTGSKKNMLDFIFELIDLNDERFADSKEELMKKLNEL